LRFVLLFYRFESKWDIRLRLVDKDFRTRLGFRVVHAIWYLKIPYPSTIFCFVFSRKVLVLFSSKYFIDESDRGGFF